MPALRPSTIPFVHALVSLLAVLVLCGLAGKADAVVLDFESLASSDGVIHEHPSIYSEKGFSLRSLTAAHEGELTDPYGFGSAGAAHPFFPGSTSLFNNNTEAWTELTRDGGGVFTLLSVDISEGAPGLFGQEASFLAFLANGDAVIESFFLDSEFGHQTFQFLGLVDVVRVLTPSCCGMFVQWDNFTIEGAENSVPTPSTISLLVVALGGLGVSSRRKLLRILHVR